MLAMVLLELWQVKLPPIGDSVQVKWDIYQALERGSCEGKDRAYKENYIRSKTAMELLKKNATLKNKKFHLSF